MPRINPDRMIGLLYEIHSMTQLAWELSKNPELTSILEEQKRLLELIVGTIESAFGAGQDGASENGRLDLRISTPK